MPEPTVTVRMQEKREDRSPSHGRACQRHALPGSVVALLPSRALIHLFSVTADNTMNQTTMSTASSTKAAVQQARIAIISANWHSDVVHQARDAAARRLTELGAAPARIHQVEVPGAFEIPLMAQKLAASGQFDAVIGCAVIVNGGIYHHEFVSTAVVDGLMRVQLDTGVPVFSVALTPYNFQPSDALQGFFRQHFVQKGEEAANACAQTPDGANTSAPPRCP